MCSCGAAIGAPAIKSVAICAKSVSRGPGVRSVRSNAASTTLPPTFSIPADRSPSSRVTTWQGMGGNDTQCVAKDLSIL
jgi:hypothetical protein